MFDVAEEQRLLRECNRESFWYRSPPIGAVLASSIPRGSNVMFDVAEEQRVLRECNRESFWYRSLPIGAVLASFTHMAIARGMLKPNPRFGSGPKGMGFSTVFTQ
jgi:hypothetical protein